MTMKIGLERVQAALEATRGTAITAPTHLLPASTGLVTPADVIYEPLEMAGIWTKNFRHVKTRNWGEWELEGPADTAYLPFLLNMAINANATPTTPGGGTLSRNWLYEVDQDADSIKTATLWWGDEGIQLWRAAFAVAETFTFTNDASGEDGATVSMSGMSNFPTKVAAPTPATRVTTGALLPPMAMQLWIDTSSAIGTTAVTGRLISATHEVSTGVGSGELKFLPSGPTSDLNYTAISRNAENIRATTTIKLEVPDMVQYDLWAASTTVKCRVRHSGSLIEGSLYNFFQFDTYGPLRDLSWSDHANGNRVLEFTINSQYDATLAGGFSALVQNRSTTL
jgi:hypothetical protein